VNNLPNTRSEVHEDAWLWPQWLDGSSLARVGSVMSCRTGGVSALPFDSLNMGAAVGDDPAHVAANRERLRQVAAARPVFLRQVHGSAVVRLTAAHAQADAPVLEADASVTTEVGLACTIQVADCLPVLFAAPGGLAVGAAHAGWRGLASGVLEATAHAVSELAGCAPAALFTWLGPCIGPRRFEVGADVLEGFGVAAVAGASTARFVAQADTTVGAPKWLADLPGLASDRLHAMGLSRISGGCWCTVEEASRFFSFRRDRVTGRMAAAIWIR
jgi:YfiH family protein